MDSNSATKQSLKKASGGEISQARTISTSAFKDAITGSVKDPVSFVNALMYESAELLASDILFEPRENNVLLRARIDGVLYNLGAIPRDAYIQVSARIKVLSKLDPTKTREVQEGQFTFDYEGRVINLRVEIAQTVLGELIVIRFHEKETIVMKLSQLGFSEQPFGEYQKMLKQRSGLVLVCGPTGCGKTTTLYSTINAINKDRNYNVVTIEDPVEFYLEGTNQMQTNESTGFSFAVGLSTILRMSPDVVLVGEIRDRETSQIAVEAGLTGQLVLSTLHAEDAVGALFRLLDLDIKTFLLNSSLVGIVAQRLVRKACSYCRKSYEPSKSELDFFQEVMGRPPRQLIRGIGCEACKNLAYLGRTGIFEVLRMSPKIRDLLRESANEDVLRATLKKSGFKTLLKDGLEKSEQGITTIEEVVRNSVRVY
ncbi:type II/IV secretion system protein [Patescibacteria group bacterium]|nr:type II/IV secretion system protein [Patescibacteria group bacterium]